MLSYAWQVSVFTASDAMAATGFTRSTVISLCDELVDRGWLTELANARSAGDAYSKGRPARRYALRTDAAVIVGVDAGQNTITASVADLAGLELGRASTRMPSPARVLRPRTFCASSSACRLQPTTRGTRPETRTPFGRG